MWYAIRPHRPDSNAKIHTFLARTHTYTHSRPPQTHTYTHTGAYQS